MGITSGEQTSSWDRVNTAHYAQWIAVCTKNSLSVGYCPFSKRTPHSTPDTQFRVGSSLQAGLYARTPRSVRLLRLIR
ncbi:TPA: hypothetical protein MHS14_26995 [Klebsiella pneumoniae]|nr:hypothetical protein D0898_25710 [Klebsiella pneumoniae]HBX2096417.1 hypothetical protein [Klebsiella pneumoniae]